MSIYGYKTYQLMAHGRATGQVARVADSAWRRLVGLIGTRELPQTESLLLTPCKSIHCMHMRYPIDVVYLDAAHPERPEGAGVLGVETVRPWRIGLAPRATKAVLELPAGRAGLLGIAPGDHVALATP